MEKCLECGHNLNDHNNLGYCMKTLQVNDRAVRPDDPTPPPNWHYEACKCPGLRL